MRNKLILIAAASAALMLLSQADASAQRQEYAYPHSIDLQTGYAASIIKVPGEMKNAHGLADGSLFSVRYTGYLTPHFGLFGEIGYYGTGLNSERYYAIVNNADGGKYRYDDSRWGNQMYADYSPIFKVGVATRFDYGQVSIRPRVGLGVAAFAADDNSYIRYDRTTDKKETVEEIYYNGSKDYLVDGTYADRVSSIVLSGSIQATYTFYHHFYISAEAGLDLMPMSFNKETRVSYTDEVTIDRNDITVTNPNMTAVKSTMTSMSVPDLFTVKLGIGWNLGWNRNARGGGYRF